MKQLWELLVDLWETGNYWLRLAIGIVTVWPILMLGAALLRHEWAIFITPLVTLAPIVAIPFFLMAALDPLVIGVIAAFQRGRRVLVWAAMIVGVELAIGAYLSIVPLSNDRALVPLLVLVATTVVFLSFGSPGKVRRLARGLLTIALLGITAIFFLGGRDKAWGQAGLTATQRDYPICADAPDFPLAGERGLDTIIEVSMRPECWSGMISTPAVWGNVYAQWKNGGIELKFLDGYRVYYPEGTNDWVSERRWIFRARGEGMLTLLGEKPR